MKRFNPLRNLLFTLSDVLGLYLPQDILIVVQSDADRHTLEQVLYQIDEYRGIRVRSVLRLKTDIKGLHPAPTIVYNTSCRPMTLKDADSIIMTLYQESGKHIYIED